MCLNIQFRDISKQRKQRFELVGQRVKSTFRRSSVGFVTQQS